MRAVLLLLVAAASCAEPGYVDPAQCRRCHQTIFDSYAKTGMGQSFGPAGDVAALEKLFHQASGRSYAIVKRDGVSVMRRFQEGGEDLERSIEFRIGSGNHSRTYIHRDEHGRLTELPVSWYAERGGYWAMSPGYDRPDHSDFRREISGDCLFCHNGYPSQANGGLASGIDCQRCHGPGEAHVKQSAAMVN